MNKKKQGICRKRFEPKGQKVWGGVGDICNYPGTNQRELKSSRCKRDSKGGIYFIQRGSGTVN